MPGRVSRLVMYLAGLALQVAEVENGHRECLEVGNLDVIRDFVDVRDVVRAYRLVGIKASPAKSTILAVVRAQRLLQPWTIFVHSAKTTIRVQVDPDRVRPVDQPLLIADSSKLRAAVGWQPQYSIEQTLQDMLDFSRNVVAATASPSL